jgi:hypothetical protein
VHCADAFDAVSSAITRIVDEARRPESNGASRKRFNIEAEIAGLMIASVGGILLTAGISAVPHLDRKIENVENKLEKKIEPVQVGVSDLSARFERQRGFEEGQRSRWWPR